MINMQYAALHDIKRVITSFENSINKASNKANANNKANKDIRLLDNFTYANKDVKQYYM